MSKQQLRRWHRLVSVFIALPLGLIIVTGLVLQLRNQFEFIQPSPVKTVASGEPFLTVEQVVQKVPGEMDQIIIRPQKNTLVVRMADGMEVQLHPKTGELLKSGMRRTGWLIDLHQGSFLGPYSQFGLFVLVGWGLLFLFVSGLIIYPWKRGLK